MLDERLENWLPSSPVHSVEISTESSGLIDFLATLSAALLCDRLPMMDVCLRGMHDVATIGVQVASVTTYSSIRLRRNFRLAISRSAMSTARNNRQCKCGHKCAVSSVPGSVATTGNEHETCRMIADYSCRASMH